MQIEQLLLADSVSSFWANLRAMIMLMLQSEGAGLEMLEAARNTVDVPCGPCPGRDIPPTVYAAVMGVESRWCPCMGCLISPLLALTDQPE